MVEAKKAGVAFSRNPISKSRHELVIDASYGLGEAVASGIVNPDSYIIDKRNLLIKNKKIGEKNIMLIRKSKVPRTTLVSVEKEMACLECLTGKEIKKLSKLIIRVEKHFNAPQDIEWAIDKNGKFYLLQSRPITTL